MFGVYFRIKCINSKILIKKLTPKLIQIYGHVSTKSVETGFSSTLLETLKIIAFFGFDIFYSAPRIQYNRVRVLFSSPKVHGTRSLLMVVVS